MQCSQGEGISEPTFPPALPAALGSLPDDRLGCAFSGAAADRKPRVPQLHVAHAILVVGDIAAVFRQLIAGGRISHDRPAHLKEGLDVIDCAASLVELRVPFLEEAASGARIFLSRLQRCAEMFEQVKASIASCHRSREPRCFSDCIPSRTRLHISGAPSWTMPTASTGFWRTAIATSAIILSTSGRGSSQAGAA